MSQKLIKPSILPGFMELLPKEQIAFYNMLDKIRKNYEKHGFLPLDTPIIEKSEVLLAKGGGETEKQVYRFNKGESDLSLRFDLTVPLARYVAQYMDKLNFPFKRYQIGKVYRGERNQRGRFREFYQCDIDVVGNGKLSILNDAEIPAVIYSTFTDLGFENFKIRINNRKILNGYFDYLGISDKQSTLRIIDKIYKIGIDAVMKEIVQNFGNCLDSSKLKQLESFISMEIDNGNDEILRFLKSLKIDNEEFNIGVSELSTVLNYIKSFGVPEKNFCVDLKIARGLDYYTGTVYETILDEYPEIGSVCSGGRYDNLAGYYTSQKLPGVGISIGLTRLFYQFKEAGLIKELEEQALSKVVVVPMDLCEDSQVEYALETVKNLRNNNIPSEVYLEDVKFSKKLNYVNKAGSKYCIIIGDTETRSNMLTIKNMKTGEQNSGSINDILTMLRN